MANLSLLLGFLVAATLLTITPGVDTAMVLRTAAVEGRTAAVRAGAGIVVGCLGWGAAVSLGLGALLQASALAYDILKYAGAAYLVWLGVKLLVKPRAAFAAAAEGAVDANPPSAFWRGLLTNLLNPKIGVFYVSFLPQFVPAGANVAAYSFFLACVHIALTLVWFAALIAATASLGRLLRRPGAVAILDRLTGVVFVGFGLRLAASSAR